MATQHHEGAAVQASNVAQALQTLLDDIAAAAIPEPGSMIDDEFEVVRLLGAGAMARVFQVKRGDETLALKLLDSDPTLPIHFRAEAARRFQIEAMALGQLEHPHIVRHIEFGLTHETRIPYLVMEFVDGKSLFDIIDAHEGALAPQHIARLMAQLAEALAACHAAGIVHRDIKPENVIVEHFGTADERLVLVDFGIARVRTEGERRGHPTLQHQMLGTPRYMSPEHFDAANAGPAADLYSMGVLIYELLSGRAPFESDNHFDVVFQHMHQSPDRLVLPDMADTALAAWQSLVDGLLRKSPDERPASAATVARWLRALAEGTHAAPLVRPRRFHTQRTEMLTAEHIRRALSEGDADTDARGGADFGAVAEVAEGRRSWWKSLGRSLRRLTGWKGDASDGPC